MCSKHETFLVMIHLICINIRLAAWAVPQTKPGDVHRVNPTGFSGFGSDHYRMTPGHIVQFVWVVLLRATVHNCCILAKLCPTFADSSRRHCRRHVGKIEFVMQLDHRNTVTEVLNLFITAFVVPWSYRLFR